MRSNISRSESSMWFTLLLRYVAPIRFIDYDSLANYVIPVLLIALFNTFLVLRFCKQKTHITKTVNWYRCRKMIIQLTLISVCYLLFDLPYILIVIVQSAGYPNFGNNILFPYIARLVYVPPIVLPYATLLSFSRLKQKLHALHICQRNEQMMVSSTVRR